MSTEHSTVVLVHGAWHGSWCWDRVVPLLEARGISTRTVDLPSVGVAPGVAADLTGDATAVRAVLDEVGGPVLLCGHQKSDGSDDAIVVQIDTEFEPDGSDGGPGLRVFVNDGDAYVGVPYRPEL